MARKKSETAVESTAIENQEEKKITLPKNWFGAVGRRKTSIASVRIWLDKAGKILVNNKPIEEYFPSEVSKKTYLEPFKVVNRLDAFSGNIKVSGGGKESQLEAVRHGISRSLVVFDNEAFRPLLKKYHFLTRDSREKERRHYGGAGKARKQKQSPKR